MKNNFSKRLTLMSLSAILGSCTQSQLAEKPEPEIFTGTPTSASPVYRDHSRGFFSMTISNEADTFQFYHEGHETAKYSLATSLIESEIRDGDSEKIKVTGTADHLQDVSGKPVYRIHSLEISGRKIIFD